MIKEYKKCQRYNKKNLVIYFIVRVIKFLAFQFIFGTRNIKFILLKIKNNILIKKVQGSKMYLDLNDKGISKDLAMDGIREPESTEEIKRIVKPGSTVVEVGANIGYYALMESLLAGKTGRIYALEPSPSNFNTLKKNIKLNSIANITLFQLAIGDKKGIVKMNISPHSNLNSLVAQKNRRILKTINVNVTTLDIFLKNKKYPDFIRMDVEGYEYNIIKGMKNTLKSKKPLKLFIELHPHVMKKEQTEYVLKTLRKYGFETRKVVRCVTVSEMRVMERSQYDYSHKKINDLLKDNSIISGKRGAFEIFFERE